MKYLKALGGVCATIIVLALVFGAGYITAKFKLLEAEDVVESDDDKDFDLQLPGITEKRVVTVEEVEEKLTEISELSTYSGEYTITCGKDETKYLFENIGIPLTTNSIEITCTGIVKVGYEMSEINVAVDDDKIYIALPEAKLLDNYVIWNSVECIEENNILNPIEFSQYQELIDQIEEKGLTEVTEQGIYNKAEKNVKTIINGFLSCFEDYEIVYM